MSPRAAWRLAHSMRWHGTAQLISPYVSRDVGTCGPDESISSVRHRLGPTPGAMVIVAIDQNVVLGRLDGVFHRQTAPEGG